MPRGWYYCFILPFFESLCWFYLFDHNTLCHYFIIYAHVFSISFLHSWGHRHYDMWFLILQNWFLLWDLLKYFYDFGFCHVNLILKEFRSKNFRIQGYYVWLVQPQNCDPIKKFDLLILVLIPLGWVKISVKNSFRF